MKQSGGNLQALFDAGGPLCIANCYSIVPKGSIQAIRITDADVSVRFTGPGQPTFSKDGPLIKRDKISHVLGLESSTISLTLMADDTILTSAGVPYIKAIGDGFLDGASITVFKVFADDWSVMPLLWNASQPKGWVTMFSGVVRDTKISTNEAKITVVSLSYKFETALPLNAFSPSCSNTLYDTKCGLFQGSHQMSALTGGPGDTNFKFTVYGITADYALGTVEFVEGPNLGVKRTIIEVDVPSETVTVSQPFPVQPSGEEVRVIKGCDRKLSTCTTRFANQLNFRGFPYVPNPESIA
jgi:uncharacterized phage protein (TIGR02218 family)